MADCKGCGRSSATVTRWVCDCYTGVADVAVALGIGSVLSH